MLQTTSAPAVNRPNSVAVGTIVWLGSEVMFFAGLFAIYFTLKTSLPALWSSSVEHLNIPYTDPPRGEFHTFDLYVPDVDVGIDASSLRTDYPQQVGDEPHNGDTRGHVPPPLPPLICFIHGGAWRSYVVPFFPLPPT